MARNKKPEFEYSKEFDAAMAEKFPGYTFETGWNLFIGSFGGMQTVVKDKNGRRRPLTKAMALYGSGWSNGAAARGNFT